VEYLSRCEEGVGAVDGEVILASVTRHHATHPAVEEANQRFGLLGQRLQKLAKALRGPVV
jgi:hypothetical protein